MSVLPIIAFGVAIGGWATAHPSDAAGETSSPSLVVQQAPLPLDIVGTWELDRTASDPLADLLEAQGVPYLERKIVDGLSITQVITHQGDVLTIDLHTSFRSVVQTLIVDGKVRVEPREDGGFIEIGHRWEDHALVTTARGLDREDVPFRTTTRRTLHDGGATLLQVTELVRADGSVLVVRRVYRRVAG